MKFAIVLALIAVAAATKPLSHAGVKPTQGILIIGGQEAGDREFPYQVSIQDTAEDGTYFHNCGGAIYDDLRIVTSAYCVTGNIAKLAVIAGAHDIKHLSGQEQVRSVVTVEIHEKYNDVQFNNDIAIVTLNEPLIFNQRVQPIRLAISSIEASGEAVNSGWGTTDGVSYPDKLQKVTLNVINRQTCRDDYSFIGAGVTEQMICASAPGKAACSGDSGSPLVAKDEANRPYLAGVVSWGVTPCAQNGFHSVYANIAALRGWLESKLNP